MNDAFRSLALLLIIFSSREAAAGSFGVGMHTGYGTISHRERLDSGGEAFRSESSQNAVIFGVSGEYTSSSPENIFAGLTTDWITGLEGREELEMNGVRAQATDMKFFGQFYDLRLGYKGYWNTSYYRMYISGGWDGLRFGRDDFLFRARQLEGYVREDISLWRAGVGGAFGIRRGKWAFDARAAYAFYPEGSVENSSLPGVKFHTNGTCLDLGAGLAFALSGHVNFYVGGTYTLLDLDSDSVRDGLGPVRYPESRTELAGGVINLGYSF